MGTSDHGQIRAAVLRECPGWLEVTDLHIDRPASREVLIHTSAAGLCHSDLHFIEGKRTLTPPVVLGHESAGVVEAVGRDVNDVRPGDHVITCLSAFCGHCAYCVSGRPYLCVSPELRRPAGGTPRLSEGGKPVDQFVGMGSFAEQMLVHENAVVRITTEMPLDRAALMSCGVTTGLGAVFNTAAVPPGAIVAVVGCGGVGLACIQGARLAGASRIIAVDVIASKLEMAETLGATDSVNGADGDPVEQILDLTDGGVEYSFEAIGSAKAAEQAFNMLRPGGTATVIGMVPDGQLIQIGPALLGARTLKGSLMGSNRFRVDVPRYIDLYLQGRLRLDEMVSRRITLDQVNDGFRSLQQGEVVRSVVVFDG